MKSILYVLGAGGPRFESWYPDEEKNHNSTKACKSDDLQAFLFLRCQNIPFKTVVNVTYPVTSHFLYLRGHRASHNKL